VTRATTAHRVRPAGERQDLHGDHATVAADPREQAKLAFHHLRAADLLVQRRLADHQVNARLAIAEDRLLPGKHGLDGPGTGTIIRQCGVRFGQFAYAGVCSSAGIRWAS
jgi:hypothetical protein